MTLNKKANNDQVQSLTEINQQHQREKRQNQTTKKTKK